MALAALASWSRFRLKAHVGGILTHGRIYSCAVTPLSHVALFIRHPILSLSLGSLSMPGRLQGERLVKLYCIAWSGRWTSPPHAVV